MQVQMSSKKGKEYLFFSLFKVEIKGDKEKTTRGERLEISTTKHGVECIVAETRGLSIAGKIF